MTVSVVPVGNSRGIRLPKNLITELNIGRTLQLERQGDSIILTPVHEKPRENSNNRKNGLTKTAE
jgi:antitoxin MazE